jgi:hypothetical protein
MSETIEKVKLWQRLYSSSGGYFSQMQYGGDIPICGYCKEDMA